MPLPDQQLRVSDSNSGVEFGGTVFGIALSNIPWVVGAIVAGFLAFLAFQSWTTMHIGNALALSFGPALGFALVIFFFVQGKHPSYARDWIEAIVNSGHASPLEPGKTLHVIPGLPDASLTDGLILYGSPGRGGYAAVGLWAEPPYLGSASNQAKNRFQDQVRQVLRLLPKGCRMSVHWQVDSNYQDEIRSYGAQSIDEANPVARSLRNRVFLWHWERMTRAELRRERVAIFIGLRFKAAHRAPLRTSAAEPYYNEHILQARTELTELARQITTILGVEGGRVIAMTDLDLARQFARKLNPSSSQHQRSNPSAGNDASRSLLDNFWNSELRGEGKSGFYLDGYYHGVLMLRRCPKQTFPGLIRHLTQLPFGDYDMTILLERLDEGTLVASEQKELDRLNTQLASKADERIAVTVDQKEERVRRLSQGSIVPHTGEFAIVIRAKSPDELTARIIAMKSAINGMNGADYLEASLPTTARHTFAKTLPGAMWHRHDGLRLYLEDPSAADIIPLSSTFTGHLKDADAIYCGNQNNLVGVRLFLGDRKHCTPQHTALIGGTGSGKSVLVGNLLLQTAATTGYTVIIEEGLSHEPFTRSFGTKPIVIRPDGNQTINVFDTRGLPLSAFQRGSISAMTLRMVGTSADEDRARERHATIAKAVMQLCHDHAYDRLHRLSQTERAAVAREALAVHRWSKEHQLSSLEAFVEFRAWAQENPADTSIRLASFTDADLREFESTQELELLDFIYSRLSPDEHLTLSSLRDFLELNAEDEVESRRLATLLAPWCRGGNYGILFDGPSTVSLTGRVAHIELGLIPESAEDLKSICGFAILNDVRQHMLTLPRAVRKQFVVEEVARFLDVPGGERILRELFQSYRKHNCVVLAIMQQYSQIADTAVRAALVGNARAFLIFNPGDRQDIERLAHDIGLSVVAVETILRLPRPDQIQGTKYSECLYFHTDAVQPICGVLRHIQLPDDGCKG